MTEIDIILDKYSNTTLNHLDIENINKIIDFLYHKKCNYIDDLIDDYLDLFTIPYEIFIDKYNKLNKKYNNEYLYLASSDMNLLEEFYND